MPKRYSVADARRHLPELLDQVEDGGTIEITRRGQPVAVVVSVAEYDRALGTAGTFRRALGAWAASWSPEDRLVDGNFFDSLRDRSPGRDVEG